MLDNSKETESTKLSVWANYYSKVASKLLDNAENRDQLLQIITKAFEETGLFNGLTYPAGDGRQVTEDV